MSKLNEPLTLVNVEGKNDPHFVLLTDMHINKRYKCGKGA
jgi:hypothetical protein